jgi:hypothetical protein
MNILGIQIASIAFSLFMIYFTYLSYRRKYFDMPGFIIWTLLFLALAIASVFPEGLIPVAQILKISRLFDLFMVVGIFFLIVITFINFIHTQKIKRKLENFTQEKALKDPHQKG